MIKLTFEVNRYYLAFIILNKLNLVRKKSFRKIFKKYQDFPFFYLIYLKGINSQEWALRIIYSSNQVRNISEELEKIFREIFRLKDFKRILKETNIYKKIVENQWDNNKEIVNSFLKEIIRKPLPSLDFKVIISHPSLKEGRSYPTRLIFWGHQEEWKNYSTVYLAHEIIHYIFYHYKIPFNKLSHALIELIADNELRATLERGAGHFYKRKLIGNPELLELKKKIFPYWEEYLKDKNIDIVSFYYQLAKKIKYKS